MKITIKFNKNGQDSNHSAIWYISRHHFKQGLYQTTFDWYDIHCTMVLQWYYFWKSHQMAVWRSIIFKDDKIPRAPVNIWKMVHSHQLQPPEELIYFYPSNRQEHKCTQPSRQRLLLEKTMQLLTWLKEMTRIYHNMKDCENSSSEWFSEVKLNRLNDHIKHLKNVLTSTARKK